MKFENIDQVIEEIKKFEKVPDWVTKAREYHKIMKQLVYGDDFVDLILQIDHIETERRATARKKYARSIKDVFTKILAPVSNVFSATGGAKSYDLESDAAREKLLQGVSSVKNGRSIEGWLDHYFARDIYVVDPSGIMLLEWKDEKTWITYKSIDCIRYYKDKGQNLDYVIFEPKTVKTENGEYKSWRVIDESMDWEVIQDGQTYREGESFPHDFGYCPGRINSDKMQFGKEWRLSPVDSIIETAKEYMRDRSILTQYKFLNGLSIPYRPKIICPDCHGTGKNGIESCGSCNGEGHILSKDVTDEIIIPIDMNAENPVNLPTNFAGFISPDLEIWAKYREELKDLFNEMFEAIWGTREAQEVKDQTAMGAFLNEQPIISELHKWSSVIESHESFFTELLANFYLPAKDKEKRIATVSYGRNYIIQPPEYMLSEYQSSKKNADPIIVKEKKLVEYLTSKYKNDPETLRIELKKKELEPYVHYDIKVVLDIYGQREAQKKGLFIEWWESLRQSDKNKDKKALETLRDKWMNDRLSQFNNLQN